MDFDRLQAVLKALEAESVVYAIFGGIALTLHGLARFTQDVDLFLAPEAENIERLRRALRSVYRMKRDTIRLKDRADAEMLKMRFNLEDR